MPRGASPKRERQYEHIKQSAKKEGRYGRRAEEVAARTVNNIRSEKGETKSQRSGVKGVLEHFRLGEVTLDQITFDEVPLDEIAHQVKQVVESRVTTLRAKGDEDAIACRAHAACFG